MKKLKIKEEHFKRFERRLNFYFCLKKLTKQKCQQALWKFLSFY